MNKNGTYSRRAIAPVTSIPPKGSYILLNRNYSLPGAPASESGPAAIIHNSPSSAIGVATIARDFLRGRSYYRWIGALRAEGQSVLVLSPWLPDLVFMRRFMEVDIDWREWHGGAIPETKADVIIFWLPTRAIPKFTTREAAQCLLNNTFGGGAIYDYKNVSEIDARMRDLEAAALRAQRVFYDPKRGHPFKVGDVVTARIPQSVYEGADLGVFTETPKPGKLYRVSNRRVFQNRSLIQLEGITRKDDAMKPAEFWAEYFLNVAEVAHV